MMHLPALTCEACGSRTWWPFDYANHRFNCETYAAMRRDLADLMAEYESRGCDCKHTRYEHEERDAAIVARYEARWQPTPRKALRKQLKAARADLQALAERDQARGHTAETAEFQDLNQRVIDLEDQLPWWQR